MARKVMVIGSGGREHAIVWALKNKSIDIDQIYVVPGNAGMANDAICVALDPLNFRELISFAKEKQIDLTIVGPERPLAEGIVDAFEEAGLAIFGPSKSAARLEASKVWSKEIMKKYNIPTAESSVFFDYNEALAFVRSLKDFPVVIKADGLAAGKGVFIAGSLEEAEDALDKIMREKVFGASGERIVIEEYLEGEEASVIAVTDGQYILPFPSSQDHKAIYDGDKGPNTGGMGAYSSAPVIDYDLSKEIETNILRPLVEGLKNEGIVYKGVVYAGLMITKDGPKVLEFNVRFGDPEAQVIIPRFKGDFYDLLYASVEGKLNSQSVNWDSQQCVCVVLASKGYPGAYEKGKPITGLDSLDDEVLIFHAGTALDNQGRLVTNGGRVLGISALGRDLLEAKTKAYRAVEKIDFDGKYFRTDIADKGLRRLGLFSG